LFKFAKTYLRKDESRQAKSVWNYIPPAIMPGQLNTITTASLYAVLNVVGVVFFFSTNANFTNLTIWVLVSFLLFWGAERLFFSYYKVNDGLPFKIELIRFLTGLIPFLVILGLAALAIGFINPYSIEIMELLLTATACFFIAMSLGTLVQYRLRFEAITEELTVGFNAKLAEKRPSIDRSGENKESINIHIEDNGKMVEINLMNLLYIVSDNVYQEFILLEGDKTSTTLIRNTLGNIEKSLNEHQSFLRCHRSYIVNTNKITSIIRKARQYYFVLDKTNEKIPISRNTESAILEKFTNYLSNVS
jgi:DNA-binding LytR/AlgR family response regulator